MYTFKKYSDGKNATWSVHEPSGALLCVCQYKKGARAVCEHINTLLGLVPAAAYVARRVEEEIATEFTKQAEAVKRDFEQRFKAVQSEFDEHYRALRAKGVL